MARISDKTLWDEVRKRAAVRGWDNREVLCREALTHICRRLKIADDAAREELRGRIDRLWVANTTIWGPC